MITQKHEPSGVVNEQRGGEGSCRTAGLIMLLEYNVDLKYEIKPELLSDS